MKDHQTGQDNWLPSTVRLRVSIGANSKMNVRLYRSLMAECGLLTKTGRLEAFYDPTTYKLVIQTATWETSPARCIRPMDPRGTKLRNLREEVSYYFSHKHLNLSEKALPRMSLTPVPWCRRNGAIVVDLEPWLKDNQAEMDLTQGLDISSPVLLDQANLEQIAERLRDIALEAVED